MSVFKRQDVKDKDAYYYRFMHRGKSYYGSTGKTKQAEALEYEAALRRTLETSDTVVEFVEKARRNLSGSGKAITPEDAWTAFCGRIRRKPATEAHTEMRRRQWEDFAAFMRDRHGAEDVQSFARHHVEEYMKHLLDHGRWKKDVTYSRSGTKETKWTLRASGVGARTVNKHVGTLRLVWEAGMTLPGAAAATPDPFSGIEKLAGRQRHREIFSPKDMVVIGKKARNTWLEPLFVAGLYTGMREGDICKLRWNEVDLPGGWITKRTGKTGAVIRVPILEPLARLLEKTKRGDGEFVFPDLEYRYRVNQSGLSKGVGKFLREKCKIKTQEAGNTGGRAVTLKDIHSLRHTFAYIAGVHGVPLPIVQGILGHMSQEMTKHYQAHATDADKRRELGRLPDFLASPKKKGGKTSAEKTAGDLAAQIKALAAAGDIEGIKKLLGGGKGVQ